MVLSDTKWAAAHLAPTGRHWELGAQWYHFNLYKSFYFLQNEVIVCNFQHFTHTYKNIMHILIEFVSRPKETEVSALGHHFMFCVTLLEQL